MTMMLRTLLAVLAAASSISAAALQPRQTTTDDSITYCGLPPLSISEDVPEEQHFVACRKTSFKHSEVLFWFPYYSNVTTKSRFSAHFECYVETEHGDKYLAGHAAGGLDPCWVSAGLLGPAASCPDPTAAAPTVRTCCSKKQLAPCCAFRAEGNDLNGYLNETFVHCPS